MKFNEYVHKEILHLIHRWRNIERQVKKVERIQQSVVIAAINELRYAGRQLFEIPVYFVQDEPQTPAQRSIIRRRLCVADQYLRNAEHDIVDALMGYFGEITFAATDTFGKAKIIEHFDEYPAFLRLLSQCGEKIEESRQDAGKRDESYGYIYDNLDTLISYYHKFIDAEVNARLAYEHLEYERDKVRYDLEIADKRKGFLEKVNIGLAIYGAALTTASLVLAFLFWKFGYSSVCGDATAVWLLKLCSI